MSKKNSNEVKVVIEKNIISIMHTFAFTFFTLIMIPKRVIFDFPFGNWNVCFTWLAIYFCYVLIFRLIKKLYLKIKQKKQTYENNNFNFRGIEYQETFTSKEMMEIKKKIEKDIEGGRENLKEYKNDLKQEIEKVEIEKDISMSINLPYVIILPSALAGLLGSILLDLKIYFITIFVVVAYIFVCYCILIPMTQLMKTIGKVQRQLNPELKIDGALLTLADMRTRLARATAYNLNATYGQHIRIFKTVIPVATTTAESSAAGKSIYTYDKDGTVAQAYAEFTGEV